jgi:ribosome biogenesis GTPase
MISEVEPCQGTVVRYHREYAWVELRTGNAVGETVIAKPRGKLELRWRAEDKRAKEARELEQITSQQFAVGDEVRLSPPSGDDADAHWTIEEILPRETWLIRRSEGRYHRRVQLVVANADQLAVVVAPNPTVRLGTIDRYFLAANQGGLEPLLIVNKIDLDPDLPHKPDIQNYRELGFRVQFTGAKYGDGINELRPLLADKLTVFCGHSGVGKSTLLAALTGQQIRTGEVRERDQKGRQTTVTAVAYNLPEGGLVVDTPGVREFGLAHLTWLDVHEYFSDIAALTLQCGFSDCSHQSEPGCAVLQAVRDSKLAAGRLESYRKLRAEADRGQQHWR